MIESSPPATRSTQRQLGLGDCVSIIVGIIVGSGIFGNSSQIAEGVARTFWPPNVATSPDRPPTAELPEAQATGLLLAVWCLGGVAAMLGALTFAELATTYPEEGGVYVFLTRGLGRPIGFLYAWLEFWLMRPGNVAVVALILGEYARPLLAFRGVTLTPLTWAVVAVVAITALNLLGFQVERWGQNLLTLAKVLGLVLVCAVGISLVPSDAATSQIAYSGSWLGLGVALVLVMFTFGGWSDLAYVAAEVRQPEKNLLRSLVIGVLLVTAIYLTIVWVLVRGLGYAGLVASSAPAADLLEQAWGDRGKRLVSLLVCISCLGTIHGMIFTGSRMFYALGADHRWLGWLGVWNERLAIPVRSLVAQGCVTLGLLAAFGRYADGLTRLVATTGIFYWGFFAACVLALIRLRQIDAQRPRPFRVPLYPLLPVAFGLICLAMSYAGADYAWQKLAWESLWTAAVCVSGFVLIALPTTPQARA